VPCSLDRAAINKAQQFYHVIQWLVKLQLPSFRVLTPVGKPDSRPTLRPLGCEIREATTMTAIVVAYTAGLIIGWLTCAFFKGATQ
jgi:hypothetical protein